MPDEKNNLYVFEAIELRNEYDRHIKTLEHVLGEKEAQRDRLFSKTREEVKEAAAEFDPDAVEEKLKKLQTKRVKLNQAIQISNFESQIDYQGQKVSLAEALELRKNLLDDLSALKQRVAESAFKQIIHKEERDIVHEPRHSFKKNYDLYQNKLNVLRRLITSIHRANHMNTVKYKDE